VKNLFTWIFLLSLSLSTAAHALPIDDYAAIHAVILFTFPVAFLFYLFKYYRWCYALLALTFALLISGRFVQQKADYQQVLETVVIPRDQYVSIEGVLTDYPEIHSDHSVLMLAVDRYVTGRKVHENKTGKRTFNLRLKVNGNLSHLNRGSRISADTKIYRNNDNENFFTPPLANYRLVHKIHFNGYCKSSRLVSEKTEAPWFYRFTGAWRSSIRRAIEEKYSDTKADDQTTPATDNKHSGSLDKEGVLLQAVLLGERGKLIERDKEQLIGAGVYHLLAISGAHIGIIALLCLAGLKWARVPFKSRYILTGLVLILFLVLSGFKISAQRAVIMALLIFTARVLYLDRDLYNIISFCGLLLLTLNPAAFLDAGYVLTFTLTAAIVMGRNIFPPLLQKTGRQIFCKEPSYAAELLSANLSAALAAVPLSLFYFRRYSFSGIFAGLLLVPLTAVIIGLGFLLMLIAPLWPFLGRLVLMLCHWPLKLFFLITHFFADTIQMSVYRPAPPLWVVTAGLAAFFLWSVSRKKRHKILSAVAVAGILLVVVLPPVTYAPAQLEVFFLDVGQGDAQVVVFPGGDALVIDGGGVYYSDFQVGKNILLPFLLQKKIRVRWLAVSHYHADHVRGIIETIKILNPTELWLSSEAPDEVLYNQLISATPPTVQIRKTAAPLEITIAGCRVQFLHPGEYLHVRHTHNDHSQVIKISDGRHSFLFTGDLERNGEEQLSTDRQTQLAVDVLKVPHHGSGTSSHPAFLKATAPQLAVFSYARDNKFRFPHPRVIKNYKQQHIPFLDTARRGGIRVVSLPHGLEIETTR